MLSVSVCVSATQTRSERRRRRSGRFFFCRLSPILVKDIRERRAVPPLDRRPVFGPVIGRSLRLAFVGLERNLKHSIAQRVSIQRLDGDQCFVVVRHGHESKAFAFIGLQVADHFHGLNGAERTKQLPQQVLLRVRSQIVNEQTPSSSVHRIPRQQRVRQQVTRQWGVPEERGRQVSQAGQSGWSVRLVRSRGETYPGVRELVRTAAAAAAEAADCPS